MTKKPTDAIEQLRDEHGFPSRRSLERCAKYSRKMSYLLLGMQAVGGAGLVMFGLTLVCVLAVYAYWSFIWLGFAIREHYVPAPWNVSLAAHEWIWLSLFVATRLVVESVSIYDKLLNYRKRTAAL